MPPLRDVLLAPVVDDFARVVLAAPDFRVPLDRLAPELEDLARLDFALLAVDDLDLPLLDLRPPLLADEERDEPEPELALLLDVSSLVHLPDITRWAASATASAIKVPSLVALDMTLLAAWLAVSAASSPASRIARRALGLALIAAAAAARPAASISLLSAAFASLSTVSLPPPLDEPEELLVVDLAIAFSPFVAAEDTLAP